MRYLTDRFAIAALKRGASIEQFRGPVLVNAVAAIRWVSVEPTPGGRVDIRDHVALDIPGHEIADLDNLTPAYGDESRAYG